MFDNPQQEAKNLSKKLRPIKMSDEEFELFYKEIYAEFGPKEIPALDLKEQAPAAPQEPVEAIPAEPVQEMAEEAVVEEAPMDATDTLVQEEAAKAAAVIRNVREDEVIKGSTKGVKIKGKKEKGLKGLVITLCLECLAIAGIVAYWLLYLL